MQEELIAFVPVLLLLSRRLGFNALVAVAMSLGAAAVGASFIAFRANLADLAQRGIEIWSSVTALAEIPALLPL